MCLSDSQIEVLKRVGFHQIDVKKYPSKVNFTSLESFILTTVGTPKYLAMDRDGTLRTFLKLPSKRNQDGRWVSNRAFARLSGADTNILTFITANHEYPFDIKHMLFTGQVQTSEHNLVEQAIKGVHLTRYKGTKSDLSRLINSARDLGRVVITGEEKDFDILERVDVVFFHPDSTMQSDLFYSIARCVPQLIIIDTFYWKDDLPALDKTTGHLNARGHAIVLI